MAEPNSEDKRVVVSSEWNTAERQAVIARIKDRLIQIDLEEAELRQTIRWEAPVFQSLKAEKWWLHRLIFCLLLERPTFLESNRQNFADFVLADEAERIR